MAKDVKIQIGGDIARAEASLRTLQRTGQEVTSLLQRDFDQLGIRSAASFDGQRRAADAAYAKIKASGVATADELERAQKAHASKMADIDRQQFGERTSLLSAYKENWLGATAAMAAGVAAAKQLFDKTEEAAQAQAQRAAFDRLAASHGASSEKIIADLKRVSGEAVATRSLIEKAGTAMLTGIRPDELPKLMEIARASSKITGQTVTKSFEDIALAVARGSRMILDNLGIIVSEEKAYKDYAASVGKTASELTDAERKQAFMNATVTAGQEIIDRVSATNDDAADSYARLRVETSEAGEAIAGLGVSTGIVDGLAGAFQRLRKAIHETEEEKLEGLKGQLRGVEEQIDTASKSPAFLQFFYGGIENLREQAAKLRQEIALLEAPNVGPQPQPKTRSDSGAAGAGASPKGSGKAKQGKTASRGPDVSAGLWENAAADRWDVKSREQDIEIGRDDELAKQAEDLGKRLAQLQQAMRSEEQVIKDTYAERMQLVQEAADAGRLTAQQQAEEEIKIAKDREDKLTELKKKGDRDRQQSTLATMNVIGSASAQLFGTLAATQDQESRKGFKRYKEYSKAQAGISTALSILNAMSTVQPWYAALAASIVAGAMGAVQIAKIDSMEYQGARSGGGRVFNGERYLVGERGPEVIRMNGNGTVIPNDRLGGTTKVQSVQVTQVYQMSPGISGTVQAEIMRALPAIRQTAVEAVMAAIQSGGPMAQAVGR